MPSEAEVEAAADAILAMQYVSPLNEYANGARDRCRVFARAALEAAEKVRPKTYVLSVSCVCGREVKVKSDTEIVPGAAPEQPAAGQDRAPA